jgi:hypothetical protein
MDGARFHFARESGKLAVYAPIAQLVERQFCKLDVAGSIPARGLFLKKPFPNGRGSLELSVRLI